MSLTVLLHLEFACQHRTEEVHSLEYTYVLLIRSFKKKLKKILCSNLASKALTKVLQKQYFVGWWSIHPPAFGQSIHPPLARRFCKA
jgi:hypothetical protein